MDIKTLCSNRVVSLWLFQNFINFFGTGMFDVAVYWTLVHETNGPFYVALFLILKSVTSMVMSPFAGVIADRFNRKQTVIITDLFRAAIQFGVAVFIWYNTDHIVASILIGSIFLTLASNLFFPALSSYVKDILTREQIVAAMGYRGICLQGGMLLGTAIGGVIIAVSSASIVFLIDGATFVISALVFLFFPSDRKLKESSGVGVKTSFREDLKQGITYLNQNTLVRNMLMIGLIPALCVQLLNAFLSYYCLSYLNVTSVGFGIIEAAFAAGSIFMGFGMNMLRKYVPESQLPQLSMVALTLGMLFIIFSKPLWLVVVAFSYFGAAMMLQNVAFQAHITVHTENAFMGRVLSLNYFVASAIIPAVVVGVGSGVPEIIGVWQVFFWSTILLAMTSVITFVYFRKINRAQLAQESSQEGK